MNSNPKAHVAALFGGLIASAIGFATYTYNGGNLDFVRWATNDKFALFWTIAGIAIGYGAMFVFDRPPSPS